MTYFKRMASCGILLSITLGMFGCAGTRNQQSTGEWIDSKSVGARVKAALWDDPMVNGFDINVDVWRDVVQLSGFVDTADQMQRAEEIAWGIDGVRDVENNLTLKARDANAAAVGGQSSRPARASAERTPLSPPSLSGEITEISTEPSSITTRTAPPALASGTPGVSFDQGTGRQPQTVSLSDLANNAQQARNSSVTVIGTVKGVVGESAFILADPNDGESVLVVGDPAVVGSLKQGATVSVRGRVEELNRMQLERDHGVRLDDTGAAQWRNRISVFAERINAPQ